MARWEVPGFNSRVEGRRVGPRFHLFVFMLIKVFIAPAKIAGREESI